MKKRVWMKRVMSWFMTLMLCLSLLPVTAMAETEGTLATLDGKEYTDLDNAVTDWLSNGGELKLYSSYNNGNIDFSTAKKSLIIDLNGNYFNESESMNLSGADLTIKDTSQYERGWFGGLNADKGTLTLESGMLSLDAPDSSKAKISLRGGRLNFDDLERPAIPIYTMLEGGCYLLNGGLAINPALEYLDGQRWTVGKTDITVTGAKKGEIVIGEHQVPIAVTVKVNDKNIGRVSFRWYLVKEDGTTAELANSEDVVLKNGTATYDITTDGSEKAGWSIVEKNKTYKLLCVVTGKEANGAYQWQTPFQGYELTTLPPSLEGADITFEDGNTFVFKPDTNNNSIGAITVNPTVTLNGVTLKEGVDYEIFENSNTATKVGEYTLKIKGISPNYNGTKTALWKVVPRQLSGISLTTSGYKEYDGTDTLPAGTVGNVFGSKESGNTYIYFQLKEGTDYKVTEAHLTTADAGEAKGFIVKVKLLNPNYVFDDGSTERAFTRGIALTVGQASAPVAEAGEFSVMNKWAENYTVDLATLLPALSGEMKYGDVSYKIDNVDLGNYYDAAKGKATIENGKLILPIQDVDTETESAIGAVTLTVSSTNIKDFTLKINVRATNKLVPQLEGALTVNPAEITYKDTLSKITISGTMKYGDQVVPGTFMWLNGDYVPNAGTYKPTWIFVPENEKLYKRVVRTTEITVKQAIPAGAPNYTPITADGKTLADVNLTLTGSTLSPAAGTLEWIDEAGNVLSGDTKVGVNKTYRWRFTPTDGNYTILTGEIELYHVDMPVISAQPKNASVKAGESAVFGVTAKGTDLTYQWQIDRNDGKGFVDISGANSATYTSGVTSADCNGFRYRCVIRNAAGAVTSDTVALTIEVANKTVSYKIIEGANSSWTKNVDGSLTFRGNGEFTKFVKVLVDGKEVAPKNYTVAEGSTIITLKQKFLKTLSKGRHTLEIVWTDGSASTHFTVAKNTVDANDNNKKADSSKKTDGNQNAGSTEKNTSGKAPSTGDASQDALWLMLMISLAGIAGTLTIRKKSGSR